MQVQLAEKDDDDNVDEPFITWAFRCELSFSNICWTLTFNDDERVWLLLDEFHNAFDDQLANKKLWPQAIQW